MTRLPKIESTKMRLPGVGMIQDLVGYRLPLVTRILVSGWLPVTTHYHYFSLRVVPVTTDYQNFRMRVVTGYQI